MASPRYLALDQEHAAFRAFAGLVRDDFGVHWAGVFNARAQRWCIEIRHILREGTGNETAAKIGNARLQPDLCKRTARIGFGQGRNCTGIKGKDRARSRHLRPDHAGRIQQIGRQRAGYQKHIRMARRNRDMQPRCGQIQPMRARHVRPRHHKGTQIARHGPCHQPVNAAVCAFARPRKHRHCRLNAPCDQP